MDGLTAVMRYALRHRDRKRASSKKHYLNNLEYYRQYYKENKETYRKHGREFANKNPMKIRSYVKKYRLKNSDRLKKIQTSPHGRYMAGRSLAKRRGLEWDLIEADYVRLISRRCEYCDGSLPVYGHGLDRIDNSKGYVLGNVVPSCWTCNKMRSDCLTYEEMKVAMDAVRKFRLSKITLEVPLGSQSH